MFGFVAGADGASAVARASIAKDERGSLSVQATLALVAFSAAPL